MICHKVKCKRSRHTFQITKMQSCALSGCSNVIYKVEHHNAAGYKVAEEIFFSIGRAYDFISQKVATLRLEQYYLDRANRRERKRLRALATEMANASWLNRLIFPDDVVWGNKILKNLDVIEAQENEST